jgi:putative phosphoribosyl transferase
MKFRDRSEAGRVLAEKLRHYAGREGVLVLALPRGGVPVAYEVAAALDAPLDVFLVRKLGLPGHQEFAMGAVAAGGAMILDQTVLDQLRISSEDVAQVVEREKAELARRERLYRDARPPPEVRDRTVILVDDGLATGATMRVAAAAVRRRAPQRLVIAVPVAAGETCQELRAEADEIVCARIPAPFYAVGAWYEDFRQTTDEEVRRLLAAAEQAS